MTRPITPMTSEAMTSPRIHAPKPGRREPESLRRRDASGRLEGDEAAEHVERPVRHVDDAHQPEDEREAARDDEVEPREREARSGRRGRRAAGSRRLVGDPGEHERNDEHEQRCGEVAPGLRLEHGRVRRTAPRARSSGGARPSAASASRDHRLPPRARGTVTRLRSRLSMRQAAAVEGGLRPRIAAAMMIGLGRDARLTNEGGMHMAEIRGADLVVEYLDQGEGAVPVRLRRPRCRRAPGRRLRPPGRAEDRLPADRVRRGLHGRRLLPRHAGRSIPVYTSTGPGPMLLTVGDGERVLRLVGVRRDHRPGGDEPVRLRARSRRRTATTRRTSRRSRR